MPYREGLVKIRYIGRTLIMPNQESRRDSTIRKLKLITIEFRNKAVLLADESLVRGNTSCKIVEIARTVALGLQLPIHDPDRVAAHLADVTEAVGAEEDGFAALAEAVDRVDELLLAVHAAHRGDLVDEQHVGLHGDRGHEAGSSM